MLFVAPLPPPITGQAVACDALERHLESSGAQVDTVRLDKPLAEDRLASLRRVLRALSLARRFSRGKQYDLVYLNLAQTRLGNLRDLALLAVLRAQASSVVLHLHGGAGLGSLFSRRSGPQWKLSRRLMSRCAGVITLSQDQASIFDGIFQPESIRHVPNYADDEVFVTAGRKSGIDDAEDRAIHVLFLSNFLDGKGWELLLEAVPIIHKKYDLNIVVTLAGSFPDQQREHDVMTRASALDGVNVVGAVWGAEKADLYRSADLFCLPTTYSNEGQPIVLLEAYAAACAVVTSEHGSIPAVFEDGLNGWFCDPLDASDLAEKIFAAASDRSRLVAIGRHNAELARSKFTKSRHLENMQSALSELTGNVI